jgi:protein-tyrosine phosphatase
MIDIHCHILPGVDDGPRDLEESLAMARMAVADGIRAIVATPHTLNGIYLNPREDILDQAQVLGEALVEHHIPLILFVGADVHFEEDLIRKLETGEVLPINGGKYLLLELPSQSIPFKANEFFFEIRVKGYFPIITHLERNHVIQKHPKIVGDWVEHGAVIQITADSLTGGFGRRAYQCSCRLLENGWVDVIATDAHSINRRPPLLSRGFKAAKKIIGEDEALKMVTTHPEMILRSMPLPEKTFPPIPFRPAKKKFFSRLFS